MARILDGSYANRSERGVANGRILNDCVVSKSRAAESITVTTPAGSTANTPAPVPPVTAQEWD